ncbi:hypothetical protein [Catellatospora chokoriensis]|uniref:hypothetical protein n=1 Tax=Catellatospora chokoriensis TaxID=310353 RepID=UPI0017863C3F|nr:hypothetical protein [Catellatospora chokoriensis]
MTLLRLLPAGAGLLDGSTSCHRATPGSADMREGGEVLGGVEVAVEDQAAHIATLNALVQGEFGFTAPQLEQVLEDGYRRSATIRQGSPRPAPEQA